MWGSSTFSGLGLYISVKTVFFRKIYYVTSTGSVLKFPFTGQNAGKAKQRLNINK